MSDTLINNLMHSHLLPPCLVVDMKTEVPRYKDTTCVRHVVNDFPTIVRRNLEGECAAKHVTSTLSPPHTEKFGEGLLSGPQPPHQSDHSEG